MMNQRIAFFGLTRDVSTNPTLLLLFEKFHEMGAVVELFAPPPEGYLSPEQIISRRSFPHIFRLWAGGPQRTLRHWILFISSRSWKSHSYIKKRSYDLFFGIDSAGVIAAHRMSKRFSVPFIYLSFEMFFRDELTSRSELDEKSLEIHAARDAAMVIIQDPWRANLLAEENRIPLEKFAYLPVSPSGAPRARNTEYLRQRFDIPKNKTIVLQPGSFAPWTYSNELLAGVSEWADDFVLVIHTNRVPSKSNKEFARLQQGSPSNVYFSTQPLSMGGYEKLVSSADIGLALYKPMALSRDTQKNIQHIGLSSGKFAFFMKYGVPTLSVRQETYRSLLKEYVFGEDLDSIHDIPEALNRIRNNYDFHSQEAKRLFSEKLDFDKKWPEIQRRILNLTGA